MAAQSDPETAPAAASFSFETLRERARTLAAKEYREEKNPELPEFLKKLNYDDYQAIHFRPEQALWQSDLLQFKVHFFHRGNLFQDPVKIHVIENGTIRDLTFSTNQFDYGTNQFAKPIPPDLHFAGLRVISSRAGSLEQPEVATFLGASYFRLVGLHQRYGASGRALAIDTAEAKGEEFPRFTEFWIERPVAESDVMVIFALLDSPSCAGAFRFVLKPGEATSADIEASVFLRKDSKKLGLAPLTSMFYFGKQKTRLLADFRPEVHDSDGLLFQPTPNDWLWRPLVNPEKEHRLSRFSASDVQGYGLIQRARDFRDYEDLEGRYELRPSLWIKRLDKWPAGVLELVEIPTPSEYNDNIVAYWVPSGKYAVGQEIHWSYNLSARLQGPDAASLLRVASTRLAPEQDKRPARFVLDFSGSLRPPLAAKAAIQARVEASRGEVSNVVVHTNEVAGGWRTFFDFVPAGKDPAELRLFLRSGTRVLSEIWVYQFQNL